MGEVVRLRHSHGEEEDTAEELEVEGTLLYGKRIGDIPGWGKERGHYRALNGEGTVLCWKKGRINKWLGKGRWNIARKWGGDIIGS